MINSLTSDSAAETLAEPPEKPWLQVSFEEPGLLLTDQGLEMTSAWSFPIGSTLKVGISCPAKPEYPATNGLTNSTVDEPASNQPLSMHQQGALEKPAKVQATGLVVSCERSPGQDGYQLTIYFLDHLAHMIADQEMKDELVDTPDATSWATQSSATEGKKELGNFSNSVIFGPAANFFGLDGSTKGGVAPGYLGSLPYFLGA